LKVFPFEIKVQWRVAGFAFDGNINPYLLYLGVKLFFKIGQNYVKP
jgi:hypothetical protein